MKTLSRDWDTIHPRHTPETHTGYNPFAEANGAQNLAHFTTPLAWAGAGIVASEYQEWKDSGEYDKATDQNTADEREAEIYADQVAQKTIASLDDCLRHLSIKEVTEEEWKRCGHIISEMWYDYFCERWEE